MSEKLVVEKTKEPVTKEKIAYELFQMDVKENDTLLVHSSLSSFGYVIGREMSVVDALLESLPQGTLVMPSQTSDNTDPSLWKNPPVPEEWIPIIKEQSPSFNPHTFSTREMGRVVECFRHYPKVKRSNHPTSSFIAKGVNARYITKKHPLTPRFGMKSPLGKLYQIDAKCILFGVDYDKATIFHLAETMAENAPKTSEQTMVKGTWTTFEDFNYDCSDFKKIGQAYEKEGSVTISKIGNAKVRIFYIRDAVDFALKWIEQNRNYPEPTFEEPEEPVEKDVIDEFLDSENFEEAFIAEEENLTEQ